ncbi:MAG: hypothetical protein DCF30_07365 [Hyphomicrobiales bacterium]|nr:MAG: hypothetical protein DCF30_07365 [Hyphomicrobiales bacterium]
MPTPSFRFPGVLNSQELLVAEAIHARAWRALMNTDHFDGLDETAAKARLGGIVMRLMSDRSKSVGDLSAAAISTFRGDAPR